MEPESAPGEITQLLERWQQGDPASFDELAPLVYDELRAIAEAYLRNERSSHTLQPTAVVNEVFIDLLRLRRVSLRDRSHFFAFAARLARRVLVDSARRAKAAKRAFKSEFIPLNAELDWLSLSNHRDTGSAALDLTNALDELAAFDPSKTRAIELRYFLGCTVEETADFLQTSKRTVERNLEFSLSWLRKRLDAQRGSAETP